MPSRADLVDAAALLVVWGVMLYLPWILEAAR